MGRYANRTVRLDFPDLSEDGDDIYVIIRNPKTVPADALMPGKDLEVGADGKPLDEKAAIDSSYEVMCNLIVEWHVYDGLDDADDAPPLELPATPDKLKTLPFEIIKRITDEMKGVLSTPR